jgi:hypothetical protein
MKSRQAIRKYDRNYRNEALERWQMNQDPLAHLCKTTNIKKLEEALLTLAEEDDSLSSLNNPYHAR